MSMLSEASNQWAVRPSDQRFSTLPELRDACFRYYNNSIEAAAEMNKLRVDAVGESLVLLGSKDNSANFSHYSFGQLCRLARLQHTFGETTITATAPPDFLRVLPPPVAAMILNCALEQQADKKVQLWLTNENGDGLIARAITSEIYERIPNFAVADWCLSLPSGWRVPPARPAQAGQPGTRIATQADCIEEWAKFGLAVRPGDLIAPAGLYASDHDCFIFMVNPEKSIDAGGGKEPMSRGFFVKNSEVGDSSLVVTCFYMSYVCGNHLIWGAQSVQEFRLRHVGEFDDLKRKTLRQLGQFANASAAADEQLIAAARRKQLAESKDALIDMVFQKGIFSRKQAEASYEMAEKYSDIHGSPRSAWGYASGATRASQGTAFQDQRDVLDRGAAKILRMSW